VTIYNDEHTETPKVIIDSSSFYATIMKRQHKGILIPLTLPAEKRE